MSSDADARRGGGGVRGHVGTGRRHGLRTSRGRRHGAQLHVGRGRRGRPRRRPRPQVTLSGGGKRRILYMNTCDPRPELHDVALPGPGHAAAAVLNIALERGNSTGETPTAAAAARSSCAAAGCTSSARPSPTTAATATGPDLGGGAVRVLAQYRGRAVVRTPQHASPAAGAATAAALSSIGVSWTRPRSVHGNRAIGRGANPAHAGTPGGGSGGAIYNDGNRSALKLNARRGRTAPARAAAGSSSSATTARAPSRSRAAGSGTTPVRASRPQPAWGSSTWARASRRSPTASCADLL